MISRELQRVAWPRPRRPSPEATHRALLFAAVILAAAVAMMLALLPIVSGVGRAVKDFDGQFLAQEGATLELPPFPERSTVYAADGSVLATLFRDENRKIISLDAVNEATRDAVLAIEDDSFYEHGPVDVFSILRALVANLNAGEVVQGGSTISQQLVKNVHVGADKTLARKLQEAQAAILLEKTYTKDEILELYLNEVYLGHGVYGIGTAAEYYFARPTKNLSLPQAALLAGMIAAPEAFDPIDRPEAALGRRGEVLVRMRDLGWITEQEYATATAAPMELSSARRAILESATEPYFVDYIKSQLLRDRRLGRTPEARYDAVFRGGLKIHTTLDPALQEEARSAIESYLPNPGQRPPADPSSAMVSIVPETGAIRSIVGGSDFARIQFDLASDGARPTGSAFKAFTLVAALEEGVPPGKVYDSAEPIFIPECDDWSVSNAEPGNDGYMNLWDATQSSVNVVFAQLARDVGPDHIAEAAARMGITADLPAICSLTLGTIPVSPLDMTSAYATLGNDGVHCKPFAVARVETRYGKAILNQRPSCAPAIDPEIAAQVTAMLSRVVAGGTGFRANIGRPAAGKTGTGQEFRDAWFIGYVPQLATGVWVGYPAGQQYPMDDVHGIEVLGGTYPAQIWHDFMAAAVAGLAVEYFPAPPPERAGTVPDVRGLVESEAEEVLAEENFTTISEEVDSAEPEGTVVEQSPGPGATIALGAAVTISVSNGVIPTVAVPDVAGLTEAQAVATLKDIELTVAIQTEAVEDGAQDGVVIRQAPGAGVTVPLGSKITIVVGNFEPPPSPSPTPSPSPSPTPSPSPSGGG